jgi:hypothetical protein
VGVRFSKGKYNRLSLDKAEMVNWTFENEKLDCRHSGVVGLPCKGFADHAINTLPRIAY